MLGTVETLGTLGMLGTSGTLVTLGNSRNAGNMGDTKKLSFPIYSLFLASHCQTCGHLQLSVLMPVYWLKVIETIFNGRLNFLDSCSITVSINTPGIDLH